MDNKVIIGLDEYNKLLEFKNAFENGKVYNFHVSNTNELGTFYSQTFDSFMSTTDALEYIEKLMNEKDDIISELERRLEVANRKKTDVKSKGVFGFIKWRNK